MRTDYVESIFKPALDKIGAGDVDIYFDIPKNEDHGDLSCNVAMRLAKQLGKNPRAIAQDIINNIEYDSSLIYSIEIAGAGFINVKYQPAFYTLLLKEMIADKETFGKSKKGKGKRVNVEYVSVNPTGLLHLGHGRNACIGDTVANLYKWTGYEVTREYYFNNAGNQMKMLADSIYARYMQIDKPDFLFPEDGYHGEYVKEIAEELYKKHSNNYAEGTYQDLTEIRKFGEGWCFEKIKKTLNRISIFQDIYFNEDTLYKSGKISEVIEFFKAKGLAYEKEGALWLALSKMGLEDDRVIVKSTGEPTYRLPDIAYHRDKLQRGYDIVVDLFGADHIATIPDVLAGVKALGFDPSKVRVLIHQFVTLTENGQQVKMSKRTGKSYTLDDLLDEVGEDVVRFFLLMRGSNTHLEFDLSLAREQSDKNPVFYLQYAHARICSIFEKAKEQEIILDTNSDLSLLIHSAEIKLIKTAAFFPEAVELASQKCEPHVIADYLRELANAFHAFYHDCRIIGTDPNLASARLSIADMTRSILKNGLSILGVKAPEKM